jgi:hypothetical protein
MRASLHGRHPVTFVAPECPIDLERLDMKIRIVDFIEYFLSFEGPIIIANTSMISSYDQVAAAVVLSKNRMKNGFSRPPISHLHRIDFENDTITGIVILEQNVIAFHTDFSRNVIRLEFTDKGMDQDAITHFKRNFCAVLVASMDGIARLKSGDRIPSSLFENGPCFGRPPVLLSIQIRIRPFTDSLYRASE